MRKAVCFLGFMLALVWHVHAQRYLVRFKDKGSSTYTLSNPLAYLSQAAIDRRQRYHIAIDSTDLPVTPRYLDSLKAISGVTILNASRWLNQVSVQINNNPNALAKINSFPFVITSSQIASRQAVGVDTAASHKFETAPEQPLQRVQNVQANYFNYGNSFTQIHLHNGEFLHNIGLRGQTMTLAILDAGFYQYTSLRAFDSVNAGGQVLATWDFVNGEASVVEDYYHGMQVFSIIAGNVPGALVGSAPKARFYLYRTEDVSSEYPIEEHNWVCGAERADSSGANVLISSLGYGTFNAPAASHTYAELNGNTTIAAKGANLASKKGLLVFNSAGNEGASTWHYILTPADADSILTIGAVDANRTVAAFSSYGPSSDGQVKPDVASLGVSTVLQAPGGITASNGTSYAAPNFAGLGACLWQAFPEFNNFKIMNAIRQSGSIFSSPDNRIGYGIPDLKKAFLFLLKDFATSSATVSNCITSLQWTSKDVDGMKYEIERMLPGQGGYTKVGERMGSGSILANHTYQFTDSLQSTPEGQVSYRIKQIIDTAAATLSMDYIDTAAVTASCSPGSQISIMPNPANKGFIIVKTALEKAIEKLSIRIMDAQGQTIKLIQKNKPSGVQTYQIDLPGIHSGKYYVSIYDGPNRLVTKELIVIRP